MSTAPAKAVVITPEIAQGAFDWLLSDSAAIATARANVVRAEFGAKKAFALAYKKSTDGSIESRKMDATCSAEYTEAMERLATAEGTWERMKDQRERAKVILECWRTQEASGRTLDRFR